MDTRDLEFSPFAKLRVLKSPFSTTSWSWHLYFYFTVILPLHMLCMSWNHTLIVLSQLTYLTVTWCDIPELIAVCVILILLPALFSFARLGLYILFILRNLFML